MRAESNAVLFGRRPTVGAGCAHSDSATCARNGAHCARRIGRAPKSSSPDAMRSLTTTRARPRAAVAATAVPIG